MHSAKTSSFFITDLKANGHLTYSLPQQPFQAFLEGIPAGYWEPDMLLFYGEAESAVSDALAFSVLGYLVSQRLTTSRNPLGITRGASALKLFHEI